MHQNCEGRQTCSKSFIHCPEKVNLSPAASTTHGAARGEVAGGLCNYSKPRKQFKKGGNTRKVIAS